MVDANKSTEGVEISTNANAMKSAPMKVKRSGGFTLFFIFLIAMLALASSGYLYYSMLKLQQTTQSNLNDMNNRYAMMMASHEEQTSQLHQEMLILEGRVNALSPRQNILYQVNELIGLANEVLVLYHDTTNTIGLLNYAKDTLLGNNDPIYTDLKFALSSDIQKLTQLPVIDIVVISGKLDGIADGIDKMFLLHNNMVVHTIQPVHDMSKWQKFVSNIKQTLRGLVSISTPNSNLILTYSDEMVVKQWIKFDLLSAKLALLNHDEREWSYSLNNARQNLSKYFMAYAGAPMMLEQITGLLNTQITSVDANIDATLKTLKKLNSL